MQLLKNNKFWDVWKLIVEEVYLTTPSERIQMGSDMLQLYYPDLSRAQAERMENSVLRVVAYMEQFKDTPIAVEDDDG